jgi:hypothetical protein
LVTKPVVVTMFVKKTEGDDVSLFELTSRTKRDLNSLIKLLSELRSETITNVAREELKYELCKLTNMLVPEAPRKIAEIIFAKEENDRNEKEKEERGEESREETLVVSEKERGADLTSSSGKRMEHKQSKVKKQNNYRCNINWPFPKHPDPSERRKKMLETIEEKTKDGGLVVEIDSGVVAGWRLNEYRLSYDFLKAYFEDLDQNKFPTSDTMNWGCERCNKCQKYHKLEEMKILDGQMTALKKAGEKEVERWRKSNARWRDLVSVKSISSQCGLNESKSNL